MVSLTLDDERVPKFVVEFVIVLRKTPSSAKRDGDVCVRGSNISLIMLCR